MVDYLCFFDIIKIEDKEERYGYSTYKVFYRGSEM